MEVVFGSPELLFRVLDILEGCKVAVHHYIVLLKIYCTIYSD